MGIAKNKGPSLSICIPSYQSERWIRTAIESALAQVLPVAEILVSDDHSQDGTFDIVDQYRAVSGVRVVRQSERLGLGRHYRFLIENARADYICILSADDALFPTFSQTMLGALADEENTGMVAGGWLECNGALNPLRARGLNLPRQDLNPPEGFRVFSKGCTYIISASVLSRKLLLQTAPLPPEAALPTDWYWGLMLGLHSKLKFIRQPVAYYRFHEANASHSNAARWRQAAEAMILFVQARLDTTEGIRLEETLRKLRTSPQPDSNITGEMESRNLATTVKDLLKSLIALRYRRLPKFISMAESGKSVILDELNRGKHSP